MKSNSAGWLRRLVVFLLSIMAAIVLIGIMRFTLGPTLQEILLDADAPFWPFTVQNIMWVALFIGFGELFLRWSAASDEQSQLKRGYLPTDDRKLDVDMLDKIKDSIKNRRFAKEAFLPRMITRTIDQYRISGKEDQAISVLNSSLELYICLLYTSPSPRDGLLSRMPSSA